MPFRFLNNYRTELGVALAAGVTTLEITGDGAEFADASASTPYALTLCERNIRGVDLRREIVHVTGRAGSVLTIVRAREGTTDDDWPLGTPVEARDTAAGLNEAAQSVTAHEAKADPHPQYRKAIAGVEHQVVMKGAPLDMTLAGDAVTITVPTGYVLYLDFVDLVITASSAPTGTPSIVAGPDATDDDTYLANSAISVDAIGDREAFMPLVTVGISEIRIAVNTAGGGTLEATPVLRGYLLEV